MKQRNLMVLTLSCALLIIIELGVSIIYSDYIYNPAKGLISINVASQSYNDPNWEPGMENPTSSQNAANLMQEIDDWANSAKALAVRESTRLKATRSMTRIQMITYCFRAKLI